jgi:hypothetical protein
MKPVSPELWGKDHFTTLLYIASVCVDNGGEPKAECMRTWPGRPLRGKVGARQPLRDKGYPTCLRDGSEVSDHDDWDCVDDMVHAGLILWEGTGTQPKFRLTDKGWALVGLLLLHRSEGKRVANFPKEKVLETIK